MGPSKKRLSQTEIEETAGLRKKTSAHVAATAKQRRSAPITGSESVRDPPDGQAKPKNRLGSRRSRPPVNTTHSETDGHSGSTNANRRLGQGFAEATNNTLPLSSDAPVGEVENGRSVPNVTQVPKNISPQACTDVAATSLNSTDESNASSTNAPSAPAPSATLPWSQSVTYGTSVLAEFCDILHRGEVTNIHEPEAYDGERLYEVEFYNPDPLMRVSRKYPLADLQKPHPLMPKPALLSDEKWTASTMYEGAVEINRGDIVLAKRGGGPLAKFEAGLVIKIEGKNRKEFTVKWLRNASESHSRYRADIVKLYQGCPMALNADKQPIWPRTVKRAPYELPDWTFRIGPTAHKKAKQNKASRTIDIDNSNPAAKPISGTGSLRDPLVFEDSDEEGEANEGDNKGHKADEAETENDGDEQTTQTQPMSGGNPNPSSTVIDLDNEGESQDGAEE